MEKKKNNSPFLPSTNYSTRPRHMTTSTANQQVRRRRRRAGQGGVAENTMEG
jgi:hypothetical protein